MERAKENLQGIKQERKATDKNNERAREKAKRLTSGDKEAGNQVSSGAHQLVTKLSALKTYLQVILHKTGRL